MPNPTIDHLTKLDGTAYDLKDTKARSDIESIQRTVAGGTSFVGLTTTAITDQSTTNPITISGKSYTANNGNIVVYGSKEYAFDGTKWFEVGDITTPVVKRKRLEANTPMENGEVNLELVTSIIPLSVWSTNTICTFLVRGSTATWWVRLTDRNTGDPVTGTSTTLPINVAYIEA